MLPDVFDTDIGLVCGMTYVLPLGPPAQPRQLWRLRPLRRAESDLLLVTSSSTTYLHYLLYTDGQVLVYTGKASGLEAAT